MCIVLEYLSRDWQTNPTYGWSAWSYPYQTRPMICWSGYFRPDPTLPPQLFRSGLCSTLDPDCPRSRNRCCWHCARTDYSPSTFTCSTPICRTADQHIYLKTGISLPHPPGLYLMPRSVRTYLPEGLSDCGSGVVWDLEDSKRGIVREHERESDSD